MKYLSLLLLFFLPFVAHSQTYIYSKANYDTSVKAVSGAWKKGFIVDGRGNKIEGEIRGFLFKGDDVKSFRYRPAKGEKSITYKAEDCLQVFYGDLIIVSLPKNLKKPEGKRRFYVTVYFGEHFSVLQDPKASTVEAAPNMLTLNQGQMLNMLGFKDNKLHKLSKLKFRKQIKKLLSDNPKWVEKAMDKKWLKYDNIFAVLRYYNETKKD